MLRIPQNLCKRAIFMLNARMMMNAVAMNTGCSTSAIRHLRQCFQAIGHMEEELRSGRPRVMTHGQDRHDSEHSSAQWLPNCHSYCF